ncbi:hypothetical protein TRFO_09404 [Tritrichomonas foetus]|uniref:DOCKER domain-containing protein n=1 Tax=Tritrichomonas foetus TaxID=1144522 RepID=A0A1J4JDZ7_9EUKA|nr:hypothetical protein TRFO_09404 [Tritrichomonas foetus]|eukprot:OHS97422.1 hypothetical protein TRFO_09404 [Tritrichomonas foetus]
MIHHILSCQILFPSKSLNDLYYLIYEADNHLNSNPNQTKRTTLRILWELSKDKNFLNLEKFMFINENYKDFSKMYHNAIGYISDVRTKPVSLREEDELSDALECLVHLSNDAEYPKFEAKMWKLLVSLNLTCRNHIEAVISMNNYLKLVPCDNEHIKPFLDFTAICGRELHVQMYFKMIELCIHSNFDEYAIPFIDELKNKCIIPFKHVELMPQLTKLESSIYYNISSKSRVNSVFFRVTFLGNQFNNYYRNRTFIYRRDYDPDASNIFKKEIKNKFINATIEVSNPPPVDENNEIIFDDKNMCIYIQSIMPAYQEEIDDAFYAPAVDSIPKYLSEFKENDNIVIFRSENAIIENEKDVISLIFYPVMQHYYSTKKTFPTVRRRIEIDGKRYFNRSLDAITYTTLLIHRQVRKLESEKFWLQNITKNGKVPSEAYIIKMQQAISRIIQTGAGKSKKYAEVFLHKDYLKKNPQQKEKIENLSAILDQQTTAIDDAIKYLITVETEKTKPLNQKILEHYTVMMLELKPLLRKPT